MHFHVLACDYDGTLATDGVIAPETMDALAEVRRSGRRILLITGRQFDDLLAVCSGIDFFDLVIAENGAVIHDPRTKRTEDLAERPPDGFLRELERRGVPYSTGRVIVSTVTPHEVQVLEAIRSLGLELQIIFNKESVMVLPSGISKESGLRQALTRLGISPHNTVGVGDAENDHAFLRHVGFAAAVANAIPTLAAEVDLVTAEPNGAGVRQLAREVVSDLDAFRPRLLGRTVTLGTTADGGPLTYPIFGPNFLVIGRSGSGKSMLTGVFVERLVCDGYVICVIDPEGDSRALADHEGVIVLSSEPGTDTARAEEIDRLLRHRSTSIAIDLSALGRDEKIGAGARFLHAIQRLRAETGAPHWVIVDEAHHLFPPSGGRAEKMLRPESGGICLVTNEPESLSPAVLGAVGHVFSTSVAAFERLLPVLGRDPTPGDALQSGGELQAGEALSVGLRRGAPAAVRRFRVAARETTHERHVKKYATGKLPLERRFRFRGPHNALDLTAENLDSFTRLAKGVDDATWLHHLRNGDVAEWIRNQIKDAELAAEIDAIAGGTDPVTTRRATLEAIARRYTLIADAD